MKYSIFIFAFICAALLILTSRSGSNAYFTDGATSANNTFLAASQFPTTPTPTPSTTVTPTVTVTPTPTGTLVINEALYDTTIIQNIAGQGGANRGEWVEIYNPTSAAVSLAGWTIEDNDGASGSESLSGSIPAGGFLIVTGATKTEFEALWGPSSAQFVQTSNGTIGNGLANGGDNLILKNGGTEVDKMSWGTNTTGFSSGCTTSCPTVSSGHSLERNPGGFDTNVASDFVDRSTPTPGT